MVVVAESPMSGSRSISTRIILAAIAAIAAILIALGGLEWWHAAVGSEERLQRQGREIAARLATGQELALWNTDTDSSRLGIAGELASLGVRAITVFNEPDARDRLAAGRPPKAFVALAKADDGTAKPAEGALDDATLLATWAAVQHDGKTIGALVVQLDRAGQRAELRQVLVAIALRTLAAAALIALALWWSLRRLVTRPLNQVLTVLAAMAGGDTSRRLPTGRDDELGRLALEVNRTVDGMQDLFRQVAAKAAELTSAAELLDGLSGNLGGVAEETRGQAGEAAGTAGRVDGSTQAVAAACEQMNATITEVAKTASEAKQAGDGAADQARRAAEGVQRLGAASAEVAAALDGIAKIAARTNLLALNASIEAASAGDAGRGFAVVAGEVKELANQAGSSSEAITRRITAMQQEVATVVEVIGRIVTAIDSVSALQTGVAAAVEEQTSATREISASSAASAEGTRAIAAGMERLADAARRGSEGAASTREAAARLKAVATELQRLTQPR
jgi:methyl-accepting chemotaxis protein